MDADDGESEDVQMQPLNHQHQGLENEDDSVTDIVNAHRFIHHFQERAYSVKNLKVLKRAKKQHLKEAEKIHKILKKMGTKLCADTDSDDSRHGPCYNMIQKRAMASLKKHKK